MTMRVDPMIGVIILACIAIIPFVIGMSVFFGSYKPSTVDHDYHKNDCDITGNTTDVKNYINYSEYTNKINVLYVGKVTNSTGTFVVFTTRSKTDAIKNLEEKYKTGSKITCYYSENKDDPLRITSRHLDGNKVAFAFSMVFFAITGILVVICLLLLFTIYIL